MYFIWSIINAGFVILFFALVLSLFTKGKKLFDNKYGNAIIVVLVLGVLGIVATKDEDYNKSYDLLYGKELKGISSKSVSISLEKNFSTHLVAFIHFKEKEEGIFVPTSIYCTRSGFISGHKWELRGGTVNKNKYGTYSYDISGLIHWEFLGLGFYTEAKDFQGTIDLNDHPLKMPK